MRPWWPDTVASTLWRRSKAVWRLTPHGSAAQSSGTLCPIGRMKRAHVGRPAPEPSKTAPVREVNLAPHKRHLHRRRPDGSRPSLQGAGEPHLGHAGSGLKSSAASAKVPKPSSSWQARSSSAAERSARPSASRDVTRAEWGFSLFISVCPIRPDARPAGSSPNDEPGGRLGKFIVWQGHDSTGAWRTSNHHLSS